LYGKFVITKVIKFYVLINSKVKLNYGITHEIKDTKLWIY